MPSSITFPRAFTLPMQGAVDFWQGKVQIDADEYRRLEAAAKVHAFAVSGVAQGDELNTVYQALQRAINQGTSFEDFKQDTAEIFGKLGWDKTQPHRIETIFRNNVQSAYSVGNWQELTQDDLFPALEYTNPDDSRSRDDHAANNGKVYLKDDPFWDRWYPPNGHSCRCGVIGVTKGRLRRLGITPQADGAEQPPPDGGWGYNPGKEYLGGSVQVLESKLEQWPEEIARKVVSNGVQGPQFEQWISSLSGTAGERWPVAVLNAQRAAKVGSVAVSATSAAVAAGMTAAEAAAIQEILDNGLWRKIKAGFSIRWKDWKITAAKGKEALLITRVTGEKK